MIWIILTIAYISLIFIAIAITHLGAQADKKQQNIIEEYLKNGNDQICGTNATKPGINESRMSQFND